MTRSQTRLRTRHLKGRLTPATQALLRRSVLAASISVTCLGTAACGARSPEEQLLRRFFEASRLYDTAAVEELATVIFHPQADGIVQDFEVESVGEEETLPNGTARTRARIVADVRGVQFTGPRTFDVTFERQQGVLRITAITPLQASRTSPSASSAPQN
jgi:hypothetical protein